MAQRDVRDTGTEYSTYRMTLTIDDSDSIVPMRTKRGLVGWYQQSSTLRVFMTVFGWVLFLAFTVCLVALIAFGIFVFQQPV